MKTPQLDIGYGEENIFCPPNSVSDGTGVDPSETLRADAGDTDELLSVLSRPPLADARTMASDAVPGLPDKAPFRAAGAGAGRFAERSAQRPMVEGA